MMAAHVVAITSLEASSWALITTLPSSITRENPRFGSPNEMVVASWHGTILGYLWNHSMLHWGDDLFFLAGEAWQCK
jgi:hypothetical protein